MKYMCLVYPSQDFSITPKVATEFLSARAAMKEAGVFLGSGVLQPVGSATTVRVRESETVLTDGPFAEIKEQLGGFVLLECADLDDAVRWVATLPGVRGGAVEIRPLMDYVI